MNELQSFYQLASDFCKFVQEEIQSEETLDTLISFLMRLYLSAMALPQPKREKERDFNYEKDTGSRGQ